MGLTLLCCIGQLMITIGLYMNNPNYIVCLIGRFIFGFSDSVTVFQSTILCHWFDSSKLPFVFGILLFLVKFIRAVNDNVASMFYNSTQSISGYFLLGFLMTLFSLWCSYHLAHIHETVIEENEEREKKNENSNIE